MAAGISPWLMGRTARDPQETAARLQSGRSNGTRQFVSNNLRQGRRALLGELLAADRKSIRVWV